MSHASRMTIMALASAGLLFASGCKKPSSGEQIPWPEAGEPDQHPVGVPGEAGPESGGQPAETGPEPAAEEPAAEEPAAEEPAAEEPAAEEAGEEAEEEAEEEAGKGDKGPGRVVLTPPSGKMGAVSFKHKAHQQMFGCKKCHHKMEPKSTPIACSDCHGADPDAPDLQKAFHNKCKSCHNAMGAGPTKCNGCHK